MRVQYPRLCIAISISAALLIPLSSGLSFALQAKKTQNPVAEVGQPPATKKTKPPPSVVSVVPQQGYAAPQQPPVDEPSTIRANRRVIQVGETVTFYLEPRKYFDHSRLLVEFNFGDGKTETKDQTKTEIQHQFTSAGRFIVSVKVDSPPGLPPWEKEIDPITITVMQVKVAANPRSVEVGMPVSFKATSVSKDPNLRYRFSFGDNKQTGWQESNEAKHAYSAAGDYKATVDIGLGDNAVRLDSDESDVIKVTLPPPQSIAFRVRPARVDANEPVTLSARFPENGRNIQYRFVFGDGQTSEWQDGSQITHSYGAGTYHPTAEVRVLIDGDSSASVTSAAQPVEVRPTANPVVSPPEVPRVPETRLPDREWPPYLLPILIAVAILTALVIIIGGLIVTYKVAKWAFTPKPTFVPQPDFGTAAMEQSNAAPLIDFELHLDPNVGEGFFDIIKSELSLVRAERSHP